MRNGVIVKATSGLSVDTSEKLVQIPSFSDFYDAASSDSTFQSFFPTKNSFKAHIKLLRKEKDGPLTLAASFLIDSYNQECSGGDEIDISNDLLEQVLTVNDKYLLT